MADERNEPGKKARLMAAFFMVPIRRVAARLFLYAMVVFLLSGSMTKRLPGLGFRCSGTGGSRCAASFGSRGLRLSVNRPGLRIRRKIRFVQQVIMIIFEQIGSLLPIRSLLPRKRKVASRPKIVSQLANRICERQIRLGDFGP